MSQSSARKRRLTLQIVLAAVVVAMLAACAGKPPLAVLPHPTSGSEAKTLKFREMLNVVDIGSQDFLKRAMFGRDQYDLKRPMAIDVRDHWMYIADAGEGMIIKYNMTNGRLEPIFWAGDRVIGEVSDLYIAKDYSFYVTDVLGKRVLHFSSGGRLLQVYQDGANISRPIAIHVDEENDRLYIADEVYSKVIVFNGAGQPLRGFGGRGVGEGRFRIITDMIKTRGGFYVSDRIELAVQLFDDQGQYVSHFGERELAFPTALAEDRYGRIFISDKSDSQIKVFKNGKLIDRIGRNGYGLGEFRYISDLKLRGDTLYVVDSLNGRIQVFDILPDDQVSLLH